MPLDFLPLKTSEKWSLPASDVLKQLNTSNNRLNSKEASARLEKYDQNELSKKDRSFALRMFVSQFKNALIIILIVAAIISLFLGEKTDSFVILAMVLLNACVSLVYFLTAEFTKKWFFAKYKMN